MPPPTLSGSSPSRRPRAGWVAGLALAAVSARWLWWTHRYAVDVPFRDQYDFLGALARGADPWTLFTTQLGPHRLGLGYLATAVLYRLTSWDVRAEAFFTAAALIAIAAVGLAVKRRAVGPLQPFDACIPLVALAATQFEQFAGTIILAHGAIPVLLVMLFGWLELAAVRPARVAAQVAVVSCAVFTGFGLFLAAPAAALFALGAWRDRTDGRRAALQLAALACVAGAGALFLRGYVFQPAAACFAASSDPLWRYGAFAAVILGRPFTSMTVGATPGGLVLAGVAAALWALTVAAALAALWRSRGADATARCALALATFSGLFAAGTAWGRLCAGAGTALSSRYVVYVTPAYVAGHLMLYRVERAALRRTAFALVLAVVALKELRMSRADRRWLEYYASGKARWRACYLERRDARVCDRATGFEIYPGGADDHVERLLEGLCARGAGPCAGTPGPR